MATFCRFFPKMRARYDYGVLIFILTFSLISVSGYRDDVVLDTAHRRLSTVLIGGFATVLVCILVRPVWAGEDLHKLTASNIDKLGCFLEGRHIFQQLIINYIFFVYICDLTLNNRSVFGRVYFEEQYDDKIRASIKDYKSVLNSKGVEDSLVSRLYCI